MWVRRFNGERVRNLAHMAALVDGSSERWLNWELDDGTTMVLDRVAAQADSPAILKQHAIAVDRSADLVGEALARAGRGGAAGAAGAAGVAEAAAPGGGCGVVVGEGAVGVAAA